MTWIGVDFDGTLATYHDGQYPAVGEPIQPMIDRVKMWLEGGREVRIFSNRALAAADVQRVEQFCQQHFGRVLRVTNAKDHECMALYDDIAVRVVTNIGAIVA
jgi:hypothetical protein